MNPRDLQIALDREMVRRYGLLAFITLAWPVLFPSVPFVYNWHHAEVCRHVESAYFGDCHKVLITVPPGTSKSLICSVFADAWAWTVNPAYRVLGFSFAEGLCDRDAARVRQLVTSRWYQERWPKVRFTKTAPRLDYMFTTAGGMRFTSTIHGQGTGEHGHLIRVDDPIKPSDTMRSSVVTATEMNYVNIVWWDGTMTTRTLPGQPRRYLGIMQRLAENDWVGHVCETDDPIVLRLPMRYNASKPCRTPLGGDRRTQDGELLFPEMFPEAKVKDQELILGVFAHAQLQQDPTNPDGEVFKAAWIKRCEEWPRFDELILSTDTTFKKTPGACNCSIQVWGRKGTDVFLVDNVAKQMSFADAVREISSMVSKHPTLGAKLIEDTANGPAIIETLSKAIQGIIPVKPEGGKFARANAVTHLFAAGNVWLPLDDYAPWVRGYVSELLGFPKAKYADQVDATTQALAYLSQHSSYLWSWLEQEADKDAGVVLHERTSPFAGT